MAINRIEWLAGYRWAKDVYTQSFSLLRVKDGPEKLLEMMRRGLVEKPENYSDGVQGFINEYQSALDSATKGEKK